ncbi:MAG TPA: hypothetical protein VJ184_03050 [Chryseolinea sp.]|nr:hypothetical protein [Chryseolinea sp.]
MKQLYEQKGYSQEWIEKRMRGIAIRQELTDEWNLRDNMNDLELIFTMLGEKVTTEITRSKNAENFPECKTAAIEGGGVAGNARLDAEKKIGRSVISNENYIIEPEKVKRKRLQ